MFGFIDGTRVKYSVSVFNCVSVAMVLETIPQNIAERRQRWPNRKSSCSTHFQYRGSPARNFLADLFSAVRTAWPAARSAHSFLKFRAHSLNVLSSRFRFLDGDNPADPLIAREWRNVLPFCPCHGVGNENLSQIRWYAVYRARRERFLVHRFSYHATSSLQSQ